MEQQCVPESRLGINSTASSSIMASFDDYRPISPAVRRWHDSTLEPLRMKPIRGSCLQVETSLSSNLNLMGTMVDDSILCNKPSDGLLVPSIMSPLILKDLQLLDSRFISDNWSYEAPQNMYALVTQSTNAIDSIATPYLPLQPQLEPPVEHLLPYLISPLHVPSFSSMGITGGAMPLVSTLMTTPDFTPTSSLSFSDMIPLEDPSLYLSDSPTNRQDHLLVSPMLPHSNSVKDLTLNELRPHFNKPMAVVAKELGVCITLMKKICRRNGLVRWPHRRIRSLVNRITSLQVLLTNAVSTDQTRLQMQIATLRAELSAVIQNPNKKSPKTLKETPKGIENVEIPSVLNKSLGQIDNMTSETTNDKVATKKEGGVTRTGIASKARNGARKRQSTFGFHAHQPPPITISRNDELPSCNRLRSHSVPERRIVKDRRYKRARDTNSSLIPVRPCTTRHRNGRRGSISSILNDIPE
ncbi:hypothetical protein CCR75_006298 [Bremia lactucae]|uniref:RWP-RK domain-containing protein n=1 Tax=Bremia lactucae TaxID=4779 RepID=A0A976IFZ1_BRELC|nr:hypothetical protein CCR75_006298 [Bremia lactucae]